MQEVLQQRSGRRRRQDRAGHRPAGPDREARPRCAVAATASASAMCRTSSRSRSAARTRASCSKATGGSTLSCACPSICASIWTRLAHLPIPLPAAGSQEQRSAHGAGGSLRTPCNATCRCPRWRRSRSRRARTRSAARTASAASWSSANVRGRDLGSFVSEAQAQIARDGQAAGRLLDRLGRPVRATGLGGASG